MCSGYFFFSLLEHPYQLVIHQNIKDPSRTTALAYRRNDSDNILYLVLFKLWIIHANQRLLYLSKILKYIKWEGIIKCVHVIFSFHDWKTIMSDFYFLTLPKWEGNTWHKGLEIIVECLRVHLRAFLGIWNWLLVEDITSIELNSLWLASVPPITIMAFFLTEHRINNYWMSKID